MSPTVDDELPSMTTIELPAIVLLSKATTVEARLEVPVLVWTSNANISKTVAFLGCLR